MKFILILFLLAATLSFGQSLPAKTAYPINIKQIHSGHSLTDPLFHPHWPGQYLNLIGIINNVEGGSLPNVMVAASTIPGSSMRYRWENAPGWGAQDARHNINRWKLLCITERVPLLVEGGSTQTWYLEGLAEQKEYLSRFVNNAWMNGDSTKGVPTLLWTTWTNIDNSDGPWRQMLDTQGAEFERMQDYANEKRPIGAPPIYIIPGHKMMARLYDDIQAGKVPGISNINQFFSDNIHTNELGAYAIAMIHYACIFNKSPLGLTHDLLPNVAMGTPKPSPALATYLQTMIWEVVTSYPRTGIYKSSATEDALAIDDQWSIVPNPTSDVVSISRLDGSTVNATCTLIDSQGKSIVSYPIQQNNQLISLTNLPGGLYSIRLVANGKVQVVKVVKM